MATVPQQAEHPAEAAPPTSIAKSERSLAPDIARGAMLLFIALANVPIHLSGHTADMYGHHTDSSAADTIALFIEQLFIAERSRPMFAILYGFGIAIMATRMFTKGMDPKGVRKILRRRSWWLIAFGFAHATLLFYGDILAPYGATGLIALAFVHISDKALKRWLWISGAYVCLISLPLLAMSYVGGAPPTFENVPLYVNQMIIGFSSSILLTTASGVMAVFVPLTIIGMMLQRSGWIDHPADHLPQLRRVFISGMVVGVLSSLPVSLVALGAWHPSEMIHQVTIYSTLVGGMYAGLGYICGFALMAHRWSARGRHGVPGALAAVGERSLTSYLLQSIIMAPLLTVWGLGLGDGMGYLMAFVVAAGTWFVTILLAVLMDRNGIRGPFEVALRRLTYGRRT